MDIIDGIDVSKSRLDVAIATSGLTFSVDNSHSGIDDLVQRLKAEHADVYAVDSGGKGDYLRSLGATPIDYSTDDVETYVAKHSVGKGRRAAEHLGTQAPG
jgi:hypothetical protein